MNYGGAYRNTPRIWWHRPRPRTCRSWKTWWSTKSSAFRTSHTSAPSPIPASTATNLLLHGQEFHTSYWGHLGLLNLTRNFLLPGYAAYPNTAAASLFPANANVADMAHEQHALVGYVHPYDAVPDPVKDAR